MTPEEKYKLFDRYCSKELSATEQEELMLLLKEDTTLAEEFALYQELNLHLDISLNSEKEQTALEENLKKIGDAHFDNKEADITAVKTKVIRIPTWAYAVAASVAIVFGLYFFNNGTPVYNDFANIPELSIVERGSQEEGIKNAENAFNAKEYSKAEKYLSELISEDKNNTEYLFYYGLSLLEQNKYNHATQVFDKLHKGSSVYKYKAVWFEALNQLKQKKYDQCLEVLKRIPAEAEDYNQAQKLLKKLE